MAGRSYIINFLSTFFFILTYFADHGLALKQLGSFPVIYPAFSALYPNLNTSAGPSYDLLISSFSAAPGILSIDSVSIVRNIGRYLNDTSSLEVLTVTNKVTWPNEVSGVPEKIFGKRMVAVPDGFLVPLKTAGAIRFVDISSASPKGPYVITDNQDGDWFYHRVEWIDMDGDGDLDALTCRAKEPIFGQHDSELLWLENPSGNYQTTWKPHVLAHGPDIFFQHSYLNSSAGSLECILVAGFFSKALTVFWTTDKFGRWSNVSNIHSRVIDASIGDVFDVSVLDVNGDSKDDLLVTNNGDNGSVFAYEIPSDFRTGKFIRHTLATGFKPKSAGTGKGSPGAITAVPVKNGKPVLFLSGDDSGQAYYLLSKSQSPIDWSYLTSRFLDAGGNTVGEMALADVDNDGYSEIFVPSYSTGRMYIFTLRP